LTARLTRRASALGLLALVAGCGGGGGGEAAATAVAPTLEIDSDIPDVAEGRFTVRFQFSAEPYFPGGTLPFTRSGGSTVAGSFQKRSATLYTVQIDPTPGAAGVIEIGVPKDAYADVNNTVRNDRAYSFSQAYDLRPRPGPTLSITDDVGGNGLATGAFTVTFTFDVDVGSSFTADDVLVGGATAGPLVKVSDKVYTMLVTPPAGTTGLALIQVNAGAVQAAVGGTSSAYDAALVVFYRTP